MNTRDCDVLITLAHKQYTTQRALSQDCGYALGTINQSLQNLSKEGYLNAHNGLSEKANQLLARQSPQNAIILAAGFGMRMIPINLETPKGLLEVKGEPLIERMIDQLHRVGIYEIHVVVGFMKEQYEYLIDKYGVNLIVNPEYAIKNNLHSLKYAIKHLSNSYIMPCDLWCRDNPFSKYELYPWYMVSTKTDESSTVRVNRNKNLVAVRESENRNQMLGITYLTEEQSAVVRAKVNQLCKHSKYNDSFWEEALHNDGKMSVAAKVVSDKDVIEINTYEQLRELDRASMQLHTAAVSTIAGVMGVSIDELTDIEALKKGMTNRSFLFSCKGNKYIMRIPGEGTDLLINRAEEAVVYSQVGGRNICEDIVYLNPENGYKITKYFEGARVCDPLNEADLRCSMKKLREFHCQKLVVDHCFDIFGQIEFYESLWQGAQSVYRDYEITKQNVFSLKAFIDEHQLPYVLTHIDAVPDNFLFVNDSNGQTQVRLIDWEYAGMQDPHVDIAMFCIYSMYDREQVDNLIDLYFEDECTWENRIKIYCYIASCGLLWSNWCEYKRLLGVEFGEYSLRQYRYAKDYYRIVQTEIQKKGGWANA